MEGLMDLKNLKSIRKDNKLQRIEGALSAPSSPRPSRWKQFLGAKGTVNPSLQNSPEKEEFQIDLNRFSSACSSIAKTTPCFKDMKGRTHTGAFLAKSLMMLQLDCEEREEEKELKHSICEGSDNKVKDSDTAEQEGSFCKPAVNNILAKGATVEEPLWKRRSGAKPLTLDLKKQSSHDRWRSEPHLEISIIISIYDLKTQKHRITRFLVAWTKQALKILSYLKVLLVGRPFQQKGDLHDDEVGPPCWWITWTFKMGIVSTTISRLESCRQKTEGVNFRVLWDITSDQTRWRWKFTVPKCDIVVYICKWFPKYLGFPWSWDRLLGLDLCFQDLRIFLISQYEDLKLFERKLVMICTCRIKWRDVLPCTHTKRLLCFPNRAHPKILYPLLYWDAIECKCCFYSQFSGIAWEMSSNNECIIWLKAYSNSERSLVVRVQCFVVKYWCRMKYERSEAILCCRMPALHLHSLWCRILLEVEGTIKSRELLNWPYSFSEHVLHGHMTCQSFIVHLKREQGIISAMKSIHLANLDDKVKAYSTPFILIMIVLTNVWSFSQSFKNNVKATPTCEVWQWDW